MKREGDEETDGGRTEKQRYKGAERGRQRRRKGKWMRGEKRRKKNVI